MSTGSLQTAMPCTTGEVNSASLNTLQTTCHLNLQPLLQHIQPQNLFSGVKTFHSWYLGIYQALSI